MLGRYVIVAILAIFYGNLAGCRMLVNNSRNQSLLAARQLSLRGTDALQRGRQQDAELLFSQALANSTNDERAQWGYAKVLWSSGDKSKALEHMNEAYRLSGKNPEYAVALGEMHLDQNQYDAAKTLALDILSSNRTHTSAWALLGDVHRNQKDWPSALECYHHALLLRSDFPKAQFAIADIYQRTGRPERALATLDHMVDLHASVAEDTEHLVLRGLAFADLDRPLEAKELLAKGSERLSSDQWDQQLQIIEAQIRLGDLVQARMAMGRVPLEQASNPQIQRLKSRMDSDFIRLAKTESMGTNSDEKKTSEPELIRGVYLAEPGSPSTIQR
ncbi:MAG: tetratricopeptide repeat protein [Planctomycetes bacterium]|nr:tetratricopeptide repeat protein [Planctomycetota bacterium]